MDIVDRLHDIACRIGDLQVVSGEDAGTIEEAAAMIRSLRKERDEALEMASWVDKDDQHTPAIADTYRSGAWKLNDQARQMVSNRHSKGALVWLVTWLLQRIETAERERDEARAAMARRPIETAPKDGTHVFLYVPGDSLYPTVGHYDTREYFLKEYGDAGYMEEGWRWSYGYPADFHEDVLEPTHWMPLPKPEATK